MGFEQPVPAPGSGRPEGRATSARRRRGQHRGEVPPAVRTPARTPPSGGGADGALGQDGNGSAGLHRTVGNHGPVQTANTRPRPLDWTGLPSGVSPRRRSSAGTKRHRADGVCRAQRALRCGGERAGTGETTCWTAHVPARAPPAMLRHRRCARTRARVGDRSSSRSSDPVTRSRRGRLQVGSPGELRASPPGNGRAARRTPGRSNAPRSGRRSRDMRTNGEGARACGDAGAADTGGHALEGLASVRTHGGVDGHVGCRVRETR